MGEETGKTILLTLIDDWERLCKKSLSKLKVKKSPYTVGLIRGELKAILTMKKFIIKAWRE